MSARDGVGGMGTLGRRPRFENSELTVRIYPGALAEGTIYCPISARKTTTAAEAIERVIERLKLDRSKFYVLAEVKEFGGEEWILNPNDCPVQRMMLWPRIALEHRPLSGGEDYRFLLREKNLDGSIHYGGSLQMWLQVTEERRRLMERGLLPQPESQGDHADMCCLPELNERTLLDNLRSRFRQEKIYTYVGSILIVINPFKFLPIYNPKYVKMYDNHTLGDLEPHIYAVADVAYHAMLQRRRNQCIVISGESGSGKTQSTNFLIHHLTALSQKGFASGVEQIILGAGPVLEAFGNAKTAHNNNSSRFGKFIQVNYQESGTVRGAYVEKYLLEKSRLVYQEHNERNYHVFYYLLAGASEEERKAFHLKKPEEYHYLSQTSHQRHWESYCESEPDCFNVEGEDLKHDFERLQLAMEMVGFLPATRKQIFSLLSAILHLGNIRYKKKPYRDDQIDIVNPEVLPVVSELLQVKEEMLFEALTTRKTVTVGEKLIVPYKLAEAGTVRDSMAKSLYSALFDWIVFRINHALLNIKDLMETTKILSIGVLDIFGFEDYENNSFEQFCINFANERLQHYFNQHIFKLEQEEYRAEGISWRNIDYIDNTGCINLISKKPTALFHLLDEECNFPQATNQTLLDKFKRQHEGNSYIEFPAVMEPAFIIRHYAGKVKYGVKDFREKNTDHMRPDIVALLKSSKNAFICGLIGIDPSATFRWAVLRAYFRALVAFRQAGKRHTHKKHTGHDEAAPCAVLKSTDSFSFLHHPVHQRSLEILQRCKEEKYSVTRKSPRTPLSDLQGTNTINEKSPRGSPGLGWNGRVGTQSRLSSSSSTAEDDGIFLNSTSSKLLERAHDILMRNKNYKSKPVLPKHLLNVKSLKYLNNLTLHDRITKSLLHLHKKKKPPSISAQFQASLNKLMETLGQSEPYFVKCIRSNAEKLPLRFNDNLVLRQLRYTGMLETVHIRQSGYNIKYTFKDFVHHFSVLLPEGTSATREGIQQCLDQLDLKADGYQVGKTKVFLREAERQQLQAFLHKEVLRLIVMLQRRFRAQLERKQFVRMREAAVCIQRWWRSVRSIDEDDDDYDLSVQEGAALCLQKHWRGYRDRQRFRLWRAAALVLQRAWRFWLRRRCTAALVIQAAWRCHRAREADLRLYAAVIQLQAVCKGFLTRRSFKKLREQKLRAKREQQEQLLQLQNGQVSLSQDEEEDTWEDRSYEQREKSLQEVVKEAGREDAATKESPSKTQTEAATSVPAPSVTVRERARTADEPSQRTTRAKRESRRMRELEQAQFSLELLKVRANSGGAASPCEDRRWSLELVPPASPPLLSPQGTPDSQSSKGSFELLMMDEEPPKAREEVSDIEDPFSPLPPVSPVSDPKVDVVSTSPKPAEPYRTELSDTVAHQGSPIKTDPAHVDPPKVDYLPTFYVPAGEGSAVISHSAAESQQSKDAAVSTATSVINRRESTRRPVVVVISMQKEIPLSEELKKLVRLNEEKEERQRNQQQQNEKEMMEQIRRQKEVLEKQRLYFAQYERDMFEKQKDEALLKIEQSRQSGQDVSGTAASRKPLRPISVNGISFFLLLILPFCLKMLPVPMLFQPASSEEKKKLHKTMSSGDLVKEDSLRKNSQDGRFALQLCISSKKIGKCTQKKTSLIGVLFLVAGQENMSPPCSPDLTLNQSFRDSKENREPSPKVKRRRSVKISSVALESAQRQNDTLQILTSIGDYRSMNDFLVKKINDLDAEDSKKDTLVDIVFKKALKEFRLNIFNSYSTALAMDDGKSIRYKDLHALFEQILEKIMRQEQRDWRESPVKVWGNTFKIFLDEFMIEYKPAHCALSKPLPKPERKKRRKKDTDNVEEHNGHIFKSTQYSIPTYCEYCSSLIWMMDRACVCKLCRYACHRKCCQKTTTKCSKKFDPELSSRQFGVEVSRLTNDERTVPLVVEKLINYIEMHGLYTEGIYRKSGSTNKIKELKLGLDTDVENMNLDDYNIHVIASVFKQWLRDLPNPLMTFELYDEFIRVMGLQDKKEMTRGVYSVIDQLSRTHLNTLERLIFHLVRIALEEETNRMSPNALAIVFAPCILRCPDTTDPLQSVQDINKTTACVELIICEQMNKYKVRLKDISTLEFAENKAKSKLTHIRRSMGKGRSQRPSYHIPSPPVSPRLQPMADAAIEESGGEEGAESLPDIPEHQQAAMQQEERVLTEEIESLQKEKEELTFEMLSLEPRASDDETLESEASIGTADSSENLNVDSEETISDFSGPLLTLPWTLKSDGKSPRRRVLRRQPASLDSVDSCFTGSSYSSSSHFHPSSSSSSTRRFRFQSKPSGVSSGPSQEVIYDERPQFTSRGTYNPDKGKQKLKGAKHTAPTPSREGGGHGRDPSDMPQPVVVYGSNEFMV
uniref:Myosin IXA n=1 Tax=Maylandia zebra TaxID=106582 RepID=A0A3P9C7L1_9CICH